MKVLIVEDCKVNREILAHALAWYDCEISYAEHGAEGLERFTEALSAGAPFSLVCLDLSMPVMDGFETLSRIRDIERNMGLPKTTVIIITSNDDPEDMLKCVDDGACDFMTKPVIRKMLHKSLQRNGLISWGEEDSCESATSEATS